MRSLSAGFLAFSMAFFSWASLGCEELSETRFIYTQLVHNGSWDPYPTVWGNISVYLQQATSVVPWPEKKTVSAEDPEMFENPFLVLMGREAVRFSEKEEQNLRNYLRGGGFLFIDNSEAEKNSPFARSSLALVEKLFPESAWRAIPSHHAVFRSFFLLRGVSGRRMAEPDLKGFWIQDRLAAVYCANDLLGTWARDPLGNYLSTCEPGGELQRMESFKLTVNIVLFSLTGTYKTDAIHQPFLEQKLRQ
jgi:hypothetical protein